MNKNDTVIITILMNIAFIYSKYMKIISFLFGHIEKVLYLCNRYPENNLFTLKKLIPIED